MLDAMIKGTCVWAVSIATRTAAKPTSKNISRLSKAHPVYATGIHGGQKCEAMTREEGGGLVVYQIVCERPQAHHEDLRILGTRVARRLSCRPLICNSGPEKKIDFQKVALGNLISNRS